MNFVLFVFALWIVPNVACLSGLFFRDFFLLRLCTKSRNIFNRPLIMIYRRDRNIHSIIFYEIVKTTIYQGQLKKYKMTDLSYFNCILKSLHVDLLMASSTSILMSNEKKPQFILENMNYHYKD